MYLILNKHKRKITNFFRNLISFMAKISNIKEILKYESEYSDHGLLKKLFSLIVKISRNSLIKVLTLYYTLKDEDTPKWARRVIYGALGYFIVPIDAIPDLTPVIGYSDDLLIISSAIVIVVAHIKDKHKENAMSKINSFIQKEDFPMN